MATTESIKWASEYADYLIRKVKEMDENGSKEAIIKYISLTDQNTVIAALLKSLNVEI